MNTCIDARGRSCPEPVLMTMEAMKTCAGGFDVLVDNNVAIENIKRCCGNKGYCVTVNEEGIDFKLNITRK